jgi:biuret amidohydrolase
MYHPVVLDGTLVGPTKDERGDFDMTAREAPPAVRHPTDAVAQFTMPIALDPPSTALVIVDMQYASACRSTGLGRWLAQLGRADEGNYRFDRIERLLVPNIAKLLAFFREHGLRRIFVRLGAQMAGCADMSPDVRELETAFGNIEGDRESLFLEELAPLPGEPVVTKLSVSAFTSSNIDTLLRNLGIKSLVFTGVSTSQCIDLTARDAADRGYHCVVVEDAVAEDREDFHHATLEQFQRLFGAVQSTDQVLSELDSRLATKSKTEARSG